VVNDLSLVHFYGNMVDHGTGTILFYKVVSMYSYAQGNVLVKISVKVGSGLFAIGFCISLTAKYVCKPL
jgi:hypothetical protein